MAKKTTTKKTTTKKATRKASATTKAAVRTSKKPKVTMTTKGPKKGAKRA